MNASTRALWIASVIAAACFGSVVGTVVAERPASAAPPGVQDPALIALLKGVKVDDAGNVSIGGSGGSVTIAAGTINMTGSNVTVKSSGTLQLVSGGLTSVLAGGNLAVDSASGATLTSSNLALKSGGSMALTSGGSTSVVAGGVLALESAGSATLKGPQVSICCPQR